MTIDEKAIEEGYKAQDCSEHLHTCRTNVRRILESAKSPADDRALVEKVAVAIKSKWLRTSEGEIGANPGVAWVDLATAALSVVQSHTSAQNEKLREVLALNEADKAETAAYRAVYEAARGLSRLMDEVDRDAAGQNDRVFAHFEFDQLRYAFGLVESMKRAATIEQLIKGE